MEYKEHVKEELTWVQVKVFLYQVTTRTWFNENASGNFV